MFFVTWFVTDGIRLEYSAAVPLKAQQEGKRIQELNKLLQ